mgnify:CR=1 FL=1
MLFTKPTPMKLFKANLFFIILLSLCANPFVSSAQEKGDYEWLRQRLETTRDYTLEVIDAMPDKDYDFKPTDDIRTYKAQAYHIIYSIDYFNRVFKGGSQPVWSPGDENSKSKKELIQWAKEQFEAINTTILSATHNDQLTVGIISYLDHNSHHRGQMVIYLREKGITPPMYR